MKKKLLVGIIATVLATSSYAGVKDKKAMRGADESVAEQVEKVVASCGNSELAVTFEWDAYKAMIKSNKDLLKSERYKKEWVISHAGERTVATLEAMSKICNDDADYKEEIANLTKIVIKPMANLKDYRGKFELDETTLTINFGHMMTRSPGDFVSPIKELF